MILPLLKKELREHAFVFLGLTLVFGLTLISQWISSEDAGSRFSAIDMLIAVLALVATALAHRLVHREYVTGTIDFVEGLPISRKALFLTKAGLLTTCVLGFHAFAFTVIAVLSRAHEPRSAGVLALIATRTTVFLLCVLAGAWLSGALGRYRHLVWGVLLFVYFSAEQTWDLQPASFPPGSLLREVALQRGPWPVRDLLLTAGLAVVVASVAFVVLLARGGAWARALARPMSYGEKVAVGVAFLVGIYAETQIETAKQKPRFALHDASQEERQGQVFGVGVDPRGLALDGLPAELAGDALLLRERLGLQTLPNTFVLPNPVLEPGTFLSAKLPATDGVVLEADLATADRRALRIRVLRETLIWWNPGFREEGLSWLATGIAAQVVAERMGGDDPQSLARAALGISRPISAADFDRWDSTAEELGPCVSSALAEQAVRQLNERLGERFWPAMRAQLPPRGNGHLRKRTTGRRWLEASGVSLEAMAAALDARLDAHRRGATPIHKCELSIEPKPAGKMRELGFSLGCEPGLAGDAAYTIRYGGLSPFDSTVDPELLQRFDALGQQHGVLPAAIPPGSRVLTFAEVPEPALGCTLRVSAKRWRVE